MWEIYIHKYNIIFKQNLLTILKISYYLRITNLVNFSDFSWVLHIGCKIGSLFCYVAARVRVKKDLTGGIPYFFLRKFYIRWQNATIFGLSYLLIINYVHSYIHIHSLQSSVTTSRGPSPFSSLL